MVLGVIVGDAADSSRWRPLDASRRGWRNAARRLARTPSGRWHQGDSPASQPDIAANRTAPVPRGSRDTSRNYPFLDTARHNGLQVLLAGAAVTLVVTLATLLIGRNDIRSTRCWVWHRAWQTQPACLAYTDTLACFDVPSVA